VEDERRYSDAHPPQDPDDNGDGDTQPRLVVDALGRRCPLPVIELARRIVDVAVGEIIELWADDPAAGPDVTAWCRMRGHELLSETPRPTQTGQPTDAGTAYRLRRLS
jgi:TusA-related sulfurtransferase